MYFKLFLRDSVVKNIQMPELAIRATKFREGPKFQRLLPKMSAASIYRTSINP